MAEAGLTREKLSRIYQMVVAQMEATPIELRGPFYHRLNPNPKCEDAA